MELEKSAATVPVQKFAWKDLWTKKSLWGVILIRFISDPVWYFCLFWLPGYLQEQSGLSLVQIGFLGWIPFLVADLGAVGMSSWSDRMVKKGNSPLRSRRVMLTTIACFSPLCALTPFIGNAYITIAIFSLVGVISLTWLFNINIVVSETFPVGNVSSVLGIAGGFGALGAILMNFFTGRYIGTIGAEKVFIVLALLHPIAVMILWKFIRKEK
ncbi:MAG TPA: MFS transporter, partial [Chitinophagaceae bacterium]|nr:MFS transporter [Chitinophagaceae bacterium]